MEAGPVTSFTFAAMRGFFEKFPCKGKGKETSFHHKKKQWYPLVLSKRVWGKGTSVPV